MKSLSTLTIIVLCILCTSCGHRPRGRRAMSREDSLKRIAAVAEEAHLKDMDKVRDTLIGPSATSGTGEVTRGGILRRDLMSDSIKTIVRSLDKSNAQLNLAIKDSTTPYGALMSRFSVLDTMHEYMSATYSHQGHLLSFHSEITTDDRHKVQYDLYFDHSKLVFVRERHDFTADDDEVDVITDDVYYMSGPLVLYTYRNEGRGPHRHDQMDLTSLSRYYLQGDVAGRAGHVYDLFLQDYAILLEQPLEMMVYTSSTHIQMPDMPTDKKGIPGTRGL